jgi:hypothetical protein
MIIIILLIVVVIILVIHYSNTSECYEQSKYHFDDLLEIRRRIERVLGPTQSEDLDSSKIDTLQKKYGPFFYVLIDSGNLGSKINAYHYAQSLGVPCVKKYYIGDFKNLKIPDQLRSFVIKPTNLSASRGVLIVINNDVLTENGNFTGHPAHHDDIIKHYKNKYSDKFPPNTTYVVEEFIPGKDGDRPLQCNFFSFNGTTPFIFFRKFNRFKKSETVYIYSPNKELLYPVAGLDQTFRQSFPPDTLSAMDHADRLSRSLGTFIRVDFLVNDKTGEFKMVETSTFPFCAHQKHFSSEIDELTRLWSQCFPFNDPDYQSMLKKSLQYTKVEPCKKGYM